MVRHADPARDAAAIAAIYAPNVTDGIASFETEPPGEAEMRQRMESTTRGFPWLVDRARRRGRGLRLRLPPPRPRGLPLGGGRRRLRARRPPPRGVGRELYAALLPLLVRQRLEIACAGVSLPNDASVGLHESFGFEPVGIYRRVGFKFGAWYDVGWWQLRLQGPSSAPQEPLGPQRL